MPGEDVFLADGLAGGFEVLLAAPAPTLGDEPGQLQQTM
jgi:hypothetical protein